MKINPGPILIEALPLVAAFGAFGVIYGAAASVVMGPVMTVVSSVVLFSGAAQFTMVSLAAGGAGSAAIVAAVAVLGSRHIPLAAILLPRLPDSRLRRALLALALIDETTGLAVASARPPTQTLAVIGAAAYMAWVGGTAAGVLGADLMAVQALAEVVFVILFIGLSALTCRSRADTMRAVAAAVSTVVLLLVSPGAGVLGAIVLAIGWAATSRST